MEKIQGQKTTTGNRQQIHKTAQTERAATPIEGLDATYAIAAMLAAAGRAEASQLSGDGILTSAGAVGNRVMLELLSAREGAADPAPYAARLRGGEVPRFEGDAPYSEVHPQDAFAPVGVPTFEGVTEAATFDAVVGMMPSTG